MKKQKYSANPFNIDVILSSYTFITHYPHKWAKINAYMDLINHLIELYGYNHQTFTYAIEKTSNVYTNRLRVLRYPIVIFPKGRVKVYTDEVDVVHDTGWIRVEELSVWFNTVRSILIDVFNFFVPEDDRKNRIKYSTINNPTSSETKDSKNV